MESNSIPSSSVLYGTSTLKLVLLEHYGTKSDLIGVKLLLLFLDLFLFLKFCLLRKTFVFRESDADPPVLFCTVRSGDADGGGGED